MALGACYPKGQEFIAGMINLNKYLVHSVDVQHDKSILPFYH